MIWKRWKPRCCWPRKPLLLASEAALLALDAALLAL
jgi:hypothetical protein